MNPYRTLPNRTGLAYPTRHWIDRSIERLCDFATDRAGLIRGAAPDLRACAGFDPALGRCVVYFRLGKGERFEEHREVAIAELDRWDFRLLASGSAPAIVGEDDAYCLLIDADWNDVPDLRAAMLKAVIAWKSKIGSGDGDVIGTDPTPR